MSVNESSSHQSKIPTPTNRALSRHNSSASTTSSSNKGEINSIVSTTTSVASSSIQMAKNQIIAKHKHLVASACGNSAASRSYARSTISSAVKCRGSDKDPLVLGFLASAATSRQNSANNSQASSPIHSTPVFSRSRSLRMSGGPQNRYIHSPNFYRNSSRTPELYSFRSGDTASLAAESHARLLELTHEKTELKESLDFSECERKVLLDTTHELKQKLTSERATRKHELEELKKQYAEAIEAKVRAEAKIIQNELMISNIKNSVRELESELEDKKQQLEHISKDIRSVQAENDELKKLMVERLRYNSTSPELTTECASIVTEMAKLRLELNEKDATIEKLIDKVNDRDSYTSGFKSCDDMDTLNKFLDHTVECIKKWPDELANSSHVQDLMKTLLRALPTNEQVLIEPVQSNSVQP